MLVFAVLVTVCGVASACPTCKDSLAQSDENHATLVRGYFWSILFMMSMPFLILGGLGTYMYVLIRRARAQQLSSPSLTGEFEPLAVGSR